MSLFRFPQVHFSLLVLLFGQPLLLAAKDSATPPSDGGLAAKIQPFVDNHILAGAVMLVADKDKILDLEAVGYSDLEAKVSMQPNDLFWIASMTKSFTSAALMMMVDEGKVSLDDPVEKYLPEFKGQMIATYADPTHPHPPKHPITIREVMSHTAALHGGPRAQRYTLEDDVKEMAKLPLTGEPGESYLYSEGPVIGGRIVEVVSGIPYCQFIQQRLLDPLEMKDTTFWPNAEQASHFAKTYKFNPATQTLEAIKNNPELLANPSKWGTTPPVMIANFNGDIIQDYAQHFSRPDAGLFSTATDVSKFCRMLLNGGTYLGKHYLSEEAIKTMSSDQTGGLFPNKNEGYGICFFMEKNPGQGGLPPGSFGHLGARKTRMIVDPQDGLVMVFMTQCWGLKGHEEDDLYSAFIKGSLEKYGKKVSVAH